MAENERPLDGEKSDADFELLAKIQISAIDRLSQIAKERLAYDPAAGGSTDLFTKALIGRSENSALIRLCINAGVFTYEEFVVAFADEAKELANSYERDAVAPPETPKLKLTDLN